MTGSTGNAFCKMGAFKHRQSAGVVDLKSVQSADQSVDKSNTCIQMVRLTMQKSSETPRKKWYWNIIRTNQSYQIVKPRPHVCSIQRRNISVLQKWFITEVGLRIKCRSQTIWLNTFEMTRFVGPLHAAFKMSIWLWVIFHGPKASFNELVIHPAKIGYMELVLNQTHVVPQRMYLRYSAHGSNRVYP